MLPARVTCARASFKAHGKCDDSLWTNKNNWSQYRTNKNGSSAGCQRIF